MFSQSLNTPVKRLTSFRKDRDLSLKRPSPMNSPIKNIKSPGSPSKRVRLSSNSSDISNPPTPQSPAVVVGKLKAKLNIRITFKIRDHEFH